ncbi:MAG: biotin--[acetyl-CoA-carboxylase] ligase [Bacteroidetes bacterium HGW-Bacteroidetes-15]|nr:MAG: biotin--[acetyl-CoA-carboxylase] ligase [Bacteroidetes bacterium HGW-Bacteroidetes-15]
MKGEVIGKEIIWHQELSSTNDYASTYARDPKSHGLVIAANFQTEGKGQRGNSWESSSGLNLLFSIILRPNFLEVQRQFLLSKSAALAVCDAITPLVSGVSIKWPNDIYINNCKVAGILIENSFSTAFLESSIIGIGVNVNQCSFTDDIPNPTSLKIEAGKEHDIKVLLANICKAFDDRYHMLETSKVDSISSDYQKMLYRKNEFHSYQAQGEVFRARIFGVRNSGELILEKDNGEHKEFAFKEVSYIIE